MSENEKIYEEIHEKYLTARSFREAVIKLLDAKDQKLSQLQAERDFAVNGNLQMQEIITRHGEDLLKLREYERQIEVLRSFLGEVNLLLEIISERFPHDKLDAWGVARLWGKLKALLSPAPSEKCELNLCKKCKSGECSIDSSVGDKCECLKCWCSDWMDEPENPEVRE